MSIQRRCSQPEQHSSEGQWKRGLGSPWVTWPGWAPGEQESHALTLLTSVLGPCAMPHAPPQLPEMANQNGDSS